MPTLQLDHPLPARAPFVAHGVRVQARQVSCVRVQVVGASSHERPPPAVMGLALRGEPNRASGSDPLALWLAPDSWLLVSWRMAADRLLAAIEPHSRARSCVSTDATHSLECLEVSGARAREVLASACGLDLRDRSFLAGHCARTRFAQIAVLVHRAAPDTFALYVDRSLAGWLWDWLADSAADASVPAGDP